jgi:hypothetical protein
VGDRTHYQEERRKIDLHSHFTHVIMELKHISMSRE